MLICVGAANALANPKRMLKAVPGALYEVGIAVVVALSVAPQLVESVLRVRRARRLRGGPAAWAAGAARDRDPGADRRARPVAARWPRRWTRAGTAGAPARPDRSGWPPARCCSAGLLGICVGVYGLLDGTSPGWLGLPMLLLGLLVAGCRAAAGRPAGAPQRLPARSVAAAGVGGRRERPAAGGRAGAHRQRSTPATCYPSLDPLGWPALPLGATLARARRAAAGLARAAAGVRAQPGPAGRPRERRRGGGVIRFERGDRHVRRTPRRRCCATSTSTVDEGELCLVVGRTGSGKSTLLGAINGLVPHFTGGQLAGRVIVDGRDTRDHPPRELADVVGVVGQDPLAGFVTDTVEEELAYAMEQLAVPPAVMRKRVEETLDLLGIAELRRRPLRTLSGGQQQRVAIGAVLTAHPRVLVLDEPTSALDPTAAEEVLAAITRLVHDLGITVVVAEHRLERVVQYADRLVLLTGDGAAVAGPPADVLVDSPVAPPVVELGRLAGWAPLPLSVRDARRRAGAAAVHSGGRRPAPRRGQPGPARRC